MKTLLTLAALLFAAPLFAAEPQYVVVNKAGARYVVVNRTAPACGCESSPCADARCQAYGGSGWCECRSGAAKPSGETLTTASGRTIRQTATGYVYADGDAPAQVLDCSSGKCRWVDAPSARPAYLPSVVPASYAPVSSCPGGNCSTGFRPQSRFTFPVK